MAGGIVFFVNQWTCFVENMTSVRDNELYLKAL